MKKEPLTPFLKRRKKKVIIIKNSNLTQRYHDISEMVVSLSPTCVHVVRADFLFAAKLLVFRSPHTKHIVTRREVCRVVVF